MNKRGALLAVGEMENKLSDAKILSRMDIGATTYTITYPENPVELYIFERTDGDALGRILRQRDGVVDMEYIYGRDTENNEIITVLNYTANTYLKMGFIEGAAPQDASKIDNYQNITEAGTITGVLPSVRYTPLLQKDGDTWIVTDPNDGRIFDVYEKFPSDEWGGLVRNCGPPESGSTAPVCYRYEYDDASRQVYVYDITYLGYSDISNVSFAVYDLNDPENPRLLKQGTVALDGSGNLVLDNEERFSKVPALLQKPIMLKFSAL